MKTGFDGEYGLISKIILKIAFKSLGILKLLDLNYKILLQTYYFSL